MKQLRRVLAVSALLVFLLPGAADASHSWGTYHWARTSNPFTLTLLDAVAPAWDASLGTASTDWSASSVLDTTVTFSAASAKRCRAVPGKVLVCSAAYGSRGWLGVASIWASGDHITQGTVKVNDTYFASGTYNTPAWRALVMCQEIGHTFGLGHQDESFDNANLGTCMDYTSDPSTNQHPNQHDYDQLEAIYSHLDATTTVATATASTQGARGMRGWGLAVRTSGQGRPTMFVRHLRDGRTVFTFVVWAR